MTRLGLATANFSWNRIWVQPLLPATRRLLLEPIGAAVLLLVVLSLSWMIFTAHAPGLMRLASLEIEVMIVVGVLVAALVLVSVVALLHTRDR